MGKIKLTDAEKAEAIKQLIAKLEKAIWECPRGLTENEIDSCWLTAKLNIT